MENFNFNLLPFSEFLNLFSENEDNTPEDTRILSNIICDLLNTTSDNIFAFDEGIDESLNDVSDYTNSNLEFINKNWKEDKSKTPLFLELSTESGNLYMGKVFNNTSLIYNVMGYYTYFITK